MIELIMPGAKIYRYEVPVDDAWHTLNICGDPLAVGCRRVLAVEFWAMACADLPTQSRAFRVVGTGQEMPEAVLYWGTATTPDGLFVWHLVERAA